MSPVKHSYVLQTCATGLSIISWLGHVFIVMSNLIHLEKCQCGRNDIQICQVVHKCDREGISVMYVSNRRSCYGLQDFILFFLT